MIIGLSGYARSGKDTVASILKDDGFERIAFADGIREALYALNPIIRGLESGEWDHLQTYVDFLGWEKVKLWPDVRLLLQTFGTEVGRQMFGEDVWIKYALKKVEFRYDYVVTDVRYPNEADAIRELGGQVWRINRPGFEPANSHVSEVAMDNYRFDYVLDNSGSIEDLAHLVKVVMV